MATPSLEWYKATAAEVYWNNIQQQWDDVPTYNMFGNTWTSTQTTTSTDSWSKDKEVELWLWKSVYWPMSDNEKQQYIDSLTDEQYRQMRTYKNQWYSFEASRTLLENSEWLANPTANWVAKYNPKGSFLRNAIGWAWDSATWIWQFLWNTAADIIGRTAKKLWADEDRVNYLVDDFKNYLEDSKISKSVKANTSSWTYKVTKWLTDLAQVAWLEWLAKDALPWAAWKLWALRNAWLGWKVAAWAIEWAADMGLYNIVSESELPTWKDLAIWATLWAAFPLAWAWLKAGKKVVMEKAWQQAERMLERLNKISPTKLQKFRDKFGEDAGKVLNDRWIKTRQEADNWFVRSYNRVNEALNTIKWTFKSQEVTDVLDEVVSHAEEVLDKKNLGRLKELQAKNASEWLTMPEINEVKRYFEWHTKFTYLKDWWKAAEKATNLDTALRERQRKTAAENGLENLAQLNRETQMAKDIVNASKDASKNILWAVDVTDELLAIHYGWLDRALATYVTKSVLKSDWFKIKAVDILNRLAGHTTATEVLADLKAIEKVNTKKEFDALMKKRELDPALPAPKAWWVNDAWYNILQQWEDIISTPEWTNIVKDSITEIPNNSNFQ